MHQDVVHLPAAAAHGVDHVDVLGQDVGVPRYVDMHMHMCMCIHVCTYVYAMRRAKLGATTFWAPGALHFAHAITSNRWYLQPTYYQ